MASDSSPKTTYHLYTFYASSCAARLRIAFNLKGIDVVSHYVDMQSAEHKVQDYRALNPSATIPTLVVEKDGGNGLQPSKLIIAQSIAILEYCTWNFSSLVYALLMHGAVEEVFPNQCPLLPPLNQPEERARVRELMYIITSDIFPPTNSGVAERVKAVRGSADDAKAFVRAIMEKGFGAYEQMLNRHFNGKKYSAGDHVTLADVCLIPQVEQARFYKVDFDPWPLLSGVIERLEKLDAFKKAGWQYQEDTPEAHKLKHV